MTQPNFLIVGAVKAGTTSLYHYLREHPQVFMPHEKEPHHFAPRKWCSHPAMNADDYARLFSDAGNHRAIGEASTGYLYYPQSPEMIHAAIPDCKIVVLLRDPVARAFSGYCHERREGLETVSFEQALAEEQQATRYIRGGDFSFNYIAQTLVCDKIRRYIELFGRANVHILWFDDLLTEPQQVMRALFDFLDVDPSFVGDWSYAYNPSGLPRSKILHRLLDGGNRFSDWVRALMSGSFLAPRWHQLRDWNIARGERIELNSQTKAFLQQHFAQEISCLEALTDRDLSHWRATITTT